MAGLHTAPSQAGSQETSAGTYVRANEDVTFNVGQRVMVRFPTDIPKGATISAASLILNMYSKDDTAQSFTMTIKAQTIGDSPKLVEGANEWGRTLTTAGVNWTNTFVVGADTENRTSPSIASVIQEVVSRSDWQPGGYITLVLTTTAESGDARARLNNGLIQRPQLNVTWSVAASDNRRALINLCENPNFDAALDNSIMSPSDASNSEVGYWYQNPFFGGYADSANYGTIQHTASQRVTNRNAMKFTATTPPAGNTKATGPFCQVYVDTARQFIYCGWIYIPSAVTARVDVENVFNGGSTADTITARNQWVPFCTYPSPASSGFSWLYFAVKFFAGYKAGDYCLVSEPCIIESNFRQMPFNVKNAGTSRITHYAGQATHMQHGNRQWTPRTQMLVSGTPRSRSRWTKHDSGLMILSEV